MGVKVFYTVLLLFKDKCAYRIQSHTPQFTLNWALSTFCCFDLFLQFSHPTGKLSSVTLKMIFVA